ncbi:MAG: hypothetical protein IPJ69_11690 [Deltaproteobacteria bacterium]|nr:MAG: hypothetical protein IPJ69_11690 [Deltaproteobacteria bacterium]
MKDNSNSHAVMFLCSLAQVSRSGYYDWLGRSESNRSRENRSLLVMIKSSYHESRRLTERYACIVTFTTKGLNVAKTAWHD